MIDCTASTDPDYLVRYYKGNGGHRDVKRTPYGSLAEAQQDLGPRQASFRMLNPSTSVRSPPWSQNDHSSKEAQPEPEPDPRQAKPLPRPVPSINVRPLPVAQRKMARQSPRPKVPAPRRLGGQAGQAPPALQAPSVGWHWDDSGTWFPFDVRVQRALEQAYQARQHVVTFDLDNVGYEVDLQAMVHTDTMTGTQRVVKRMKSTGRRVDGSAGRAQARAMTPPRSYRV